VQEFVDVYDLMLQHASYQNMLYANNNIQIGSTRSIVFSRDVSIDLHDCPVCRIQRYNPRYFHSQLHIHRTLCKSSCVSCMNILFFGLCNEL